MGEMQASSSNPQKPNLQKPPQQSAKTDLLGEVPVKPELATYLPKEGDPAMVKWAGRVFHANKGVKLDDPVLIEKARANKWFHVGDGAPVVEVEETPEPKTSEQYRAHCIAWAKRADQRLAEFDERWESEEGLRQTCGVSGEELDILRSAIAPMRAELKKRASLG